VLIIIGLIVGGVLAGQTLIRTAELQSVVSQLQKYTTAVYTFETKYNNELPGDMPDATSLWGATADCSQHGAQGAGPQTCDGNDNMQVDPGTREMYLFWQHLSNAGVIEGGYSGAYGPAGGAWDDVLGVNVPTTRISGYGVEFWSDGSYASPTFWAPLMYKNMLYLFTSLRVL
jgi:hypothetical protein